MLAVRATSQSVDDPLSGLTVGDVPDPEVPDGWVRVTVKAAALNHHDLWSLKGVGLSPDLLPMTLGCDAAGVLDDGTEVDVTLDDALEAIVVDRDDADEANDADDANDVRGDRHDRDDRVLSPAERAGAEKAALAAVPGTVIDVEASDDRGVSYDVEVRDADGQAWDVELDADFGVVSTQRDD